MSEKAPALIGGFYLGCFLGGGLGIRQQPQGHLSYLVWIFFARGKKELSRVAADYPTTDLQPCRCKPPEKYW
jgi:hypothetical protein